MCNTRQFSRKGGGYTARKIKKEITDKSAKLLFRKVLEAFELRYGEADDVVIHLANDIALLEQKKGFYEEDIETRGVMVEWQNGREQSGFREHPLLKEVPKLIEQQRKLLNELKLTPAALKTVPIPVGEESHGDEFDEF